MPTFVAFYRSENRNTRKRIPFPTYPFDIRLRICNRKRKLQNQLLTAHIVDRNRCTRLGKHCPRHAINRQCRHDTLPPNTSAESYKHCYQQQYRKRKNTLSYNLLHTFKSIALLQSSSSHRNKRNINQKLMSPHLTMLIKICK